MLIEQKEKCNQTILQIQRMIGEFNSEEQRYIIEKLMGW
jgi:hypothetical protein